MKRLGLAFLSLLCLNLYAAKPLFVRDAVGMKSYPAPPRLAQRAAMVPASVLPAAETTVPERIQEMRDWNASGHVPAHVGFMRQLPDPIDVNLTDRASARTAAMAFGRGIMAASDRGTVVWSTMVKVERAERIRLHLENVTLPEGTVLWSYGASGSSTGFGRELIDSHGTLWAPAVDGEVAYLDVEVPEASLASASLSFTIREVAQIFGVRPAGVIPQDNPTCLIDSTCVTTASFPAIAQARAAVAHIEWPEGSNTIGLCTGGLLNNKNNDSTPYFLTASHCFSDQNTATSAEFFFDFQTTSCGGTYNLANAPMVSGAQLLATSSTSDFTFLRLSGIPAGRYLLGWTAAPVNAGTKLFRVSHPFPPALQQIFPQMYSTTFVNGVVGECNFDPPVGNASRPRFIYSTAGDGGVYGGSSGSPEMLSDGTVVGQLLGACSSGGANTADGCDPNQVTTDGAFSNSYSFLSQWLSPSGGSSVCVPDSKTACMLNGRFKVTVRFRSGFDNSPVDTDALLKPVSGFASSNFETAFFYFNSSNNIEMLVKILDQGNTDSQGRATIAVLFGCATPLRIQLTLTDTTNGAVKVYGSAFGSMQGATDFTAFVK